MPPPAVTVPASNGQPKFRQSVAVVIGINDYGQGITRLQSAVNDATRLAALLGEQHGYQAQLLVENVTRARLVTLFAQELPSQLDANDRLLVYFAGHGVADDGDDGPAGYILPQDARTDDPTTFVAMTELNAWLNALPCRHLLLVLDCCFAGAFRWSSTRHLSLVPRTLYRERYDRFIQDPAWQVLTSAAYDQTAADLLSRLGTRADDGDHSPFALALFDALAGRADFLVTNAQGVPQGDGVITAPELYLYIRDRVDPAIPQGDIHQTPGLWPLHRHGKGEYIFLVPGQELTLPPAPALTLAANPYRGLEPYNEQHSALFFGRDELVEQLRAVVEANPLTVVTGVSGSGKSSLVKAGLLPRLRQTPEQSSGEATPTWHLLEPVRPGAKPMQALATLFEQTPATFDLPTHIQAWLAAHPAARLLLVIDQFEELITLSSEADRTQVVQQLATLLATSGDQVRVVLTVRADFEPHFAMGLLKSAWAAGRFVVTAMTQDELREVIVQPAAARVLYFEPDKLVDRIINDVVQMPGALPLLSFTMSELYLRYLARHTDDRAMTEADYDALGGVAGALRTRADAEYATLSPRHQITMQQLLLRMVSLQGTELARRRVSRSELDYAAPGENERVNEIIQRLAAARLLVAGQDETGDPYVEPAHDALIQAWDKLWNWVRAEQENLLLQRRLTPAATDWQRGGRAVGLLWDNDPRLRQADAARLAPENALNRIETEFVSASVQHRQLIQRRLIGSLAAATIVFAFLAIFAFIQRNDAIDQGNARATQQAIAVTQEAIAVTQEAIAITQRNEAERQAAISRSRELAVVAQSRIPTVGQTQATDDPQLAILVALEANAITRTFEAEDVLRRAVSASPLRATFGGDADEISSADVTANHLLLTGRREGKVFMQLLDLSSHQLLREFDVEEMPYAFEATFSPDGTRVKMLGDDNFVYVWDVASGTQLLRAPGYHATWSPDSQAIAVSGDNLAADVWDLNTGELRITVGERAEGYYENLHFSPNGQQLVTTFLYAATDDAAEAYIAKVWDLTSGELVTEFQVNRDVEFSPDGTLLAHGAGGTAILRNAKTYEEITPVTEQNLINVFEQHFSPTGQLLVTRSDDNTIRIWQLGIEISRIILVRVTPETNVDTDTDLVEFSPDERLLVTAYGSQIRLWEISSGNLLATMRQGEASVYNVRFTPDSRYLLATSNDGITRLWNTRLGEEWAMLPGATAHFSPDSTRVATTLANRVQLWDIATSLPLPIVMEHDAPIDDFLFTPNGEQLYAFGDSTVTGWNVADGQQVGAVQVVSGTVMQIALSPNAQTLATVTVIERQRDDLFDPDRYLYQVTLWSTATGAPPFVLQEQPTFSNVENLAFSPDGTSFLVSGKTIISESGGNQVVRVWDATTGVLRYALDFGRPTRAQFSPNGDVLVTSSSGDAELLLWNIADGSSLARIPAGNFPVSAEAMSFTQEGTRLVLPDGFSVTARVWDLSARQFTLTLSGHSRNIDQLQFATDGSLILTASQGDNSVRLWDGATGEMRTQLPLRATAAELSPDSRYLLAATNGVISLHLVRYDELLALARSRVTRALTCEERRDALHEEIECAVATPIPVSS